MKFIGPILVILGAIVCLSGFVIAKKPDAKRLFEKIQPYQGFLGVALLLVGLWQVWAYLIADYEVCMGGRCAELPKSLFGALMDDRMGEDKSTLAAISLLGYVVSEVLIGFILGFGLIANWIPGENAAEKKGLEIQRKLLGLSIPIGAAGLVFAILWLIKMPSWM